MLYTQMILPNTSEYKRHPGLGFKVIYSKEKQNLN